MQTTNVSIAGLNIETNPSRIGSILLDAPNAIGAVPIPASLENEALRTPATINPPTTPPSDGSLEMVGRKCIRNDHYKVVWDFFYMNDQNEQTETKYTTIISGTILPAQRQSVEYRQ